MVSQSRVSLGVIPAGSLTDTPTIRAWAIAQAATQGVVPTEIDLRSAHTYVNNLDESQGVQTVTVCDIIVGGIVPGIPPVVDNR